MIDATGSMGNYLKAAKDQCINISNELQKKFIIKCSGKRLWVDEEIDRISEISNELVKMNDQIGKINSDMTKYGTLNKEYEILSKEVQDLEGELADYNLAGDKYRSNMRAEDIEEVYNRIKLYNKKKMDESDNLFLDKAKIMEQIQQIEQENNRVLQGIEQRLLDLDPDQKNEYESIREENQNYVLQIYQLREEMADLNAQLVEGENMLRNNPNKMEAHKLKDSIKGKNKDYEKTYDTGLYGYRIDSQCTRAQYSNGNVWRTSG